MIFDQFKGYVDASGLVLSALPPPPPHSEPMMRKMPPAMASNAATMSIMAGYENVAVAELPLLSPPHTPIPIM